MRKSFLQYLVCVQYDVECGAVSKREADIVLNVRYKVKYNVICYLKHTR